MGCLLANAAGRVEPVFPKGDALFSGNKYYMYNVGSGKFLGRDGYRAVKSDDGLLAAFTLSGSGYNIKFTSSNQYLYIYNKTVDVGGGNAYNWNVSASDDNCYTVQVPAGSQYYDAGQFVGCPDDDSKYVTYTCTKDDNIKWKLIRDDSYNMYKARTELYNSLNTAEKIGCDVVRYDEVYNDAQSTIDELKEATAALNRAYELTSKYKAPDWNEYPISFETTTCGELSGDKWSNSGTSSFYFNADRGDAALTATFTLDQDATVRYNLYASCKNNDMLVVIDGKQVRRVTAWQLESTRTYFEELPAGKHTIQWITEKNDSDSPSFWLSDIGIKNTPLITVNLLEPGSLGTEILYNVDHLKDVRKLKITGSMNSDDWAKIDMMKENLFYLDLSETDIKEIKDNQFYIKNREWQFLHTVLLPEGLLKIGNSAFYNSHVENVNIPSTMQSIQRYAFYGSHIREALLPEGCLDLNECAFYRCQFLEKAALPDAVTVIPEYFFASCHAMKMEKLPSWVEKINCNAFYDCYNVSFDFPKTLTYIGERAFWCTNQVNGKNKLVIPENVTTIGNSAFLYCNAYTSAELPVYFWKNDCENILPNSIDTLTMKSPTVVKAISKVVDDNCRGNITLRVPSYLVNSYKLHEYWYNFKSIEGFSTTDVDYWPIQQPLVLNARDRFENTPSVEITTSGSLKVNGSDPMPLKDLTVHSDPDNTSYGRMFSNADGVTVAGNLYTRLRIGSKNKWYYLSLPYDVKVADIVKLNNNPKSAIRYYDGKNRAENGATGSWKNFSGSDVIPAGTGFIFQVSEAGWWKFPSLNNASKQYLSSSKMFVKALAENPSEKASDRGWNLVGNPYQCWYNIHKLNFTAPITVRENNNYAAYSVIDDDYAIAPNQAFFVQCPDGINTISFPLDGRQMTSVIESQSGAKEHDGILFRSANTGMRQRKLTDILLSDGVSTDRMRIVLNPEASLDYEQACDADKFMSDDNSVPQVYSLDAQGNRYAINERPEDNCIVGVGFYTGEGGCFTFSLKRNDSDKVLLVDKQQGITVDLASHDYNFTSDAGTFDNRFELKFIQTSIPTSIESAALEKESVAAVAGGIMLDNVYGNVSVYTVDGKTVRSEKTDGGKAFISVTSGSYVVKTETKTVNILVK